MTKSVPGSQGEKPMGMKMWYKVALIMLVSSEMMGTTPSYLQFRATRTIVMKNHYKKAILHTSLYGVVLILIIARNFGRSLAIPVQFCKRPSHFPRTRP